MSKAPHLSRPHLKHRPRRAKLLVPHSVQSQSPASHTCQLCSKMCCNQADLCSKMYTRHTIASLGQHIQVCIAAASSGTTRPQGSLPAQPVRQAAYLSPDSLLQGRCNTLGSAAEVLVQQESSVGGCSACRASQRTLSMCISCERGRACSPWWPWGPLEAGPGFCVPAAGQQIICSLQRIPSMP